MTSLVAVVGGFAGGVFVRSLTEGNAAAVFFVLAAGIFGAFYFFKRHPQHQKSFGAGQVFYTLAIAVCLSASLGATRSALSESPLPEHFIAELGERVQYGAVVVADPDVRDSTQRVQVEVTDGGATTRMLAVAPRHPSVAAGDRVFVSGTLSLPEAFADDNGRIFRYDKYLERDGVRFMLDFAYFRVEDAPAAPVPLEIRILTGFARAKHAFTDGVDAALPEPYSSLGSGIVIGGKSGLGSDLKDAFTRSGLVHIVVLSGHNVMIVASWAIAIFIALFAWVERTFKRRVSKYMSISLGALALILFVGIAGLSATAIRAALMALIALYARATSRSYAAGRALLVVILLMLIYNPLYLVFDPGFGLSVVATAGLIWLAPIIETWLIRIKSELIRSVTATALAAQIAVLPLLLYQTGNLSLVAIPANVLAALVVPFAMAFAYLAGFGGMLFATVAPLLTLTLGIPAYLAASALIYLAEASAALPFSSVILPAFPFALVVLAYAALIYFTAAWSKRLSTTPQLRFAKKAST